MSADVWLEHLRHARRLGGSGVHFPLVIVVGDEDDREFWDRHFARSLVSLLGPTSNVNEVSVAEPIRRGSMLGSLAAIHASGMASSIEPIALVQLVVGGGTRLSPFTQALRNRKAALPLPRRGSDGRFLTMVDLAVEGSLPLMDHLESDGFRGVLIRWGDEVQVPGVRWPAGPPADAYRFGSQRTPTDRLAEQKDWLLAEEDGSLISMLPRGPLGVLRAEHARFPGSWLGVNLGSLAVSFDFVEVLSDVFRHDVSETRLAADWDPYFWVALGCESGGGWDALVASEATGRFRAFAAEYPHFGGQVSEFRAEFERQMGRPPTVRAIDFGDPFWFDIGLQDAMRRSIHAVVDDGDVGRATRYLLDLPSEPDAQGNYVLDVDGNVGPRVAGSLVAHSRVDRMEAEQAVLFASDVGSVDLAAGSICGFSRVRGQLSLGANAVAYLLDASGPVAAVERERITTVIVDGQQIEMRGSEDIPSYAGRSYTDPVMGNTISFEEAGRRVERISPLRDGRST